jgi:isoquinoline 1-oxidoreductase
MDGDDGSKAQVQEVTVLVNGVARSLPATMPLLSALRSELGLTGAKPGCGEGACGSCTVLVDGEPEHACRRRVSDAEGHEVTTIESLASAGTLHFVQQAFVEIGASQCGYCTPGMVLSVLALLARDSNPDDATIDEALNGNVCRCGTYPRIRRAAHRAAQLAAQPGTKPLDAAAAADRWAIGDPQNPPPRPSRPWDLTEPEDRDWFGVLGDGLVVVLPTPPLAPGSWSTGASTWLHVDADAKVTAFTGKVDVGQDNCTALRLLVAEELRVPLVNVRLAMGDTDLCPYDMGTFGSRSMPDAGHALAQAAARARMLLPVHAGLRRIEIIAGETVLTAGTEWHLAGTSHVPEGIIDAVTGARRFGSDLTVRGLRHGAVLRPPVLGATLRELDAGALHDRDDVVLVRTRAVTGVVAGDPITARLALASLRPTWDVPHAPSIDDLEEFLRAHPSTDAGGWSRPVHVEQGDPDAAFATAAVRREDTYTTAYIAPAPLETRSALAVWDDDGRLTVWVGTQTPFSTRAEVAASLDVNEELVRVIVPPTGGGFGGKHGGGVASEAATLAREVGGPVKVTWSRHEEFTAGTLRPAAIVDVSSAAAPSGELVAWTFTNINAGPAAIASPYRVANFRIDYQPSASPLTQASYRALAATANNFARESQMDELAHELGLDPVEFRAGNLDDERLVTVLRAAAERFGWVRDGVGLGQGIACGIEKGGRIATVAQVRDLEGSLRVVRFVTAYECGAVVNPDTVINQIEGATVMALGGALFEAIRFREGVITNGSFTDYRVPRFRDVPAIEVVLLDRSDVASAGAGETPIMAVAPAIANAIFDLTGRRSRTLPLDIEGANPKSR